MRLLPNPVPAHRLGPDGRIEVEKRQGRIDDDLAGTEGRRLRIEAGEPIDEPEAGLPHPPQARRRMRSRPVYMQVGALPVQHLPVVVAV